MKQPASSEMVFNVLQREYPQLGLEDLLRLSDRLHHQGREKPGRFAWASNPNVAKQRLSKSVLKSMRPQPAALPDDQSDEALAKSEGEKEDQA